MRTFVLIFLTLFAFTSFAQRSPLDRFLVKYDWNQGLTMKEIKPGSTEFSDEFKMKGEAFDEAMASIDKVRIIKGDSASSSPDTRNAFFNEAYEIIRDKDYAALIHVHASDGENVGLYASKRKSGSISEFIFLMNGENSLLMIQLKGDIDINEFPFSGIMQTLSCGHEHSNCEGKPNSGD